MDSRWLSKAAVRVAGLVGLLGMITGCSSMTTPILHQELGETQGLGRGRVQVQLEEGHQIAILPDVLATTVTQDASLLNGKLIGFAGAFGILSGTDVEARVYFPLAGSGWRLGLKHALVGGPLAIAIMGGYGQYSGSGSFTYQTDSVGDTSTVNTVYSSNVIDAGLPVSLRLLPQSWIFTGVYYSHVTASGSANALAIDNTRFADWSVNAGFRQGFGRFDVNFELAMAKLGGPFNTGGWAPFFGLALGVGF